jgi:hypothetical protein
MIKRIRFRDEKNYPNDVVVDIKEGQTLETIWLQDGKPLSLDIDKIMDITEAKIETKPKEEKPELITTGK